MRLSWVEVCSALRGEILGLFDPEAVPASVTGVSTDNRATMSGDLFFCIRGPRFDGRDFAASAVAQGAVAVVADQPLELPNVPVVLVDNAEQALGRLAHAWRKQASARVVGVTGTAGKTTVKELLAQILEKSGKTARTTKNLNNQLGLPRSILATDGDERYWVMEVGISQPGDMDELGSILEPDLALILNAGSGHTQGLGRNVARHKAALLRWIAPEGRALVCVDYPDLRREAEAAVPSCASLEFFSGRSQKDDTTGVSCSATYIGPVSGEEFAGMYHLQLGDWSGDVHAPFRGTAGAENVAAACAAAFCLDLELKNILSGLATAHLPEQRFACSRVGEWLLIDDSYNANPLSMARMIENAAELVPSSANDRASLVCVLGEMLELGDLADEEHEQLGQVLAQNGADLVLWKGGQGACVRQGLENAHFEGAFLECSSSEDIVAQLQKHDINRGVVLIKGSRSNKLEECVNGIRRFMGAADAV